MPLTGSCNCGAITVSITDAGISPTAYCHCSHCRNQSGARGSYVMTVSESAFTVTGVPKKWLDEKTDSGTALYRHFCGDCGSPIMSVTPLLPGKAFVKMGLFEKVPKPAVEVYTRNRDEWEPPLPGVHQFEGAPGA